MLRFVAGSLFNSKAQALVNTVNCVGIMGKGIALEFKKRYPEMYEDYREKCDNGEIRPGKLTVYKNTHPWVINFPTKRHWKSQSRLEDIELGLQDFVRRYQEWGINSVAMPALGCGHGGLDWSEVKPLIEKRLGGLSIDIEVYEPGSELAEDKSSQKQKDKPGFTTDMFGKLVELPGSKPKSNRR